MRNRLLFLLTLAAALSLALAACGEKKLDTEKAEEKIKEGIVKQTSGQVPVQSVDCPKDREIKKGDTFTCKVIGTNGKAGAVTVVQQDDKGNITYRGNLQALVKQ